MPLFSAEAVTRLENKGYAVSGKANVGEFGLDLVGEFSYLHHRLKNYQVHVLLSLLTVRLKQDSVLI